MPNGNKLKSTHQGLLPIEELPLAARLAYKLPGLASHSLLSIAQLCDGGCTAIFNNKKCYILYNGKLLLSGPRDPTTKLWRIPIKTKIQQQHINLLMLPSDTDNQPVTTEGVTPTYHANNAFATKTKS